MPTYSTPGVYVTEAPLASLTSPTVGGTAAVFFGEATRGPSTATLVSDWTTYKALYGDLTNSSDLGYAVYHYFANGGRSAYVVRVTAAAAAAAFKLAVPFYPTGAGNASAALCRADAISPGAWGNNVTLTTTAGNVPSTASTYGTFNLAVTYNGTEVERWTELTLDQNGNRYLASVINNYSKFIKVSSVSAASTNALMDWNATGQALSAGTDGVIADSDYTASLTKLDVLDGNLIVNAVGKSSSTVVSGFATKVQTRGDSFLIIDPSAADLDYAALASTASNFASIAGAGYAAHYTPMLKMVDPSKTGPGAIRNTYPGGAVAGLIVRTESQRNVAKAPAGYAADVRGALGLSVVLTDAQIGTLYDGTPQVNSFKAIPGGGIVLFGARTLNKANPDKFISVRRTLNYVKYNVKALTAYAVFEPNDENLWNSLNLSVSGFLSDLWRAGALKGDSASKAFFVVCDSTNNTPFTIDNGQVNVKVGVALQTPAEFIVIEVGQWSGGSNAVETL